MTWVGSMVCASYQHFTQMIARMCVNFGQDMPSGIGRYHGIPWPILYECDEIYMGWFASSICVKQKCHVSTAPIPRICTKSPWQIDIWCCDSNVNQYSAQNHLNAVCRSIRKWSAFHKQLLNMVIINLKYDIINYLQLSYNWNLTDM